MIEITPSTQTYSDAVDWTSLREDYKQHLGKMLDFPIPNGYIERIHQAAYDLVYGVTHHLWSPNFSITYILNGSSYWDSVIEDNSLRGLLRSFIATKYGDNLRALIGGLEAYEYVKKNDGDQRPTYLLLKTAFDLLIKPPIPPTIFIAYKREISTAEALLVEARLRIAGNPNPYLDKFLVGGEVWQKRIEEEIGRRETFILLLGGEETLQSEFVREELRLAQSLNRRVIPFVHTGKTELPENAQDVLGTQHAIFMRGYDAIGLEAAIGQLLNGLGYNTYQQVGESK